MGGTRSPLQTLRQPLLHDIGGVIPVVAPRIHIAVRWSKDHVYPGLTAQLGIPGEVSGVLGQIFRRCELGGVHINAHHHHPVGTDPPPRFVHQAQVTRMQITHGRHKTDSESLAPPLQRLTLHGLGRSNDSHGESLRATGRSSSPRRSRSAIQVLGASTLSGLQTFSNSCRGRTSAYDPPPT